MSPSKSASGSLRAPRHSDASYNEKTDHSAREDLASVVATPLSGVSVLESPRIQDGALRRGYSDYGLGRGCGVGRGLGNGVDLGVAVGVGVDVEVGVGVAVGVVVGVTVGLGIGVGVTVGV